MVSISLCTGSDSLTTMMVSLRATISGFTLSRSVMIFSLPLMKPHFGAADEKETHFFYYFYLSTRNCVQMRHDTCQPLQLPPKKNKNTLPFFFFFSSSSFLSVSISFGISFAKSNRDHFYQLLIQLNADMVNEQMK